ncbi:MAG: hypothetical protein MUD14_07820 [Hydrococcus sp. Prado102]|jgi:hypothetical protein|nr:hypothetical protein [Hydrococcus sp. Prado102]
MQEVYYEEIFDIAPIAGETIALDGKVLRGSYLLPSEHLHCEPQSDHHRCWLE